MASRSQTQDPPAPVVFGALAQTETVDKAQRVFDTIALEGGGKAEAPDADDPTRTYAVQRERRADGTHGPLMLAVVVRRKARGGEVTENATRVALSDLEAARAGLLGAGIRLFAAE